MLAAILTTLFLFCSSFVLVLLPLVAYLIIRVVHFDSSKKE